MTDHRSSGASAIPTLRYRDAKAAIDWLGRAFGFEPHLVVPGPDDTVVHAQLIADGVMVMLGTAREDDFGAFQRPPTSMVPRVRSWASRAEHGSRGATLRTMCRERSNQA